MADRLQKPSNEHITAIENAVKAGEILTGAINHSLGVLHGSYKKSLPCSVPQELFCMAK
jgi:hypothetical protein